MAIVKKVSHSGSDSLSSLGGHIRIEDAKDRLIAFDGENILALFGRDSTGKVVVKTAKEGYDADTATDEQLIFNSNQNILKIAATGVASITTSTISDSLVIPHSLGSVKAAQVFEIDYPSVGTSQPLPITRTVFNGAPGSENMVMVSKLDFYVDDNNLVINIDSIVGNALHTFRYYLFQETADVT